MKPKPLALLKNFTVPLIMRSSGRGCAARRNARGVKLSIREALRGIGGRVPQPTRIERRQRIIRALQGRAAGAPGARRFIFPLGASRPEFSAYWARLRAGPQDGARIFARRHEGAECKQPF